MFLSDIGFSMTLIVAVNFVLSLRTICGMVLLSKKLIAVAVVVLYMKLGLTG